MKGLLFLPFFLLLAGTPRAQQSAAVLPAPVKMTLGSGMYVIPASAVIRTQGGKEVDDIARMFAARLNHSAAYKISANGPLADSLVSIRFLLDSSIRPLPSAYRLQVDDKGIELRAGAGAGLFYGLQTLYQLMPPLLEADSLVPVNQWTVRHASIEDSARFGWRGLMLDVARHFFTVDEVKQFIDQMAKYKFNILHWHLTDDQGWRIEIKSLPRLTRVGAWNVRKTGTFGSFSKPDSSEPRNYGGFYTQEQVREVVRYAAARYISILPEVDVPGHSMAAIASYPELACTPGNYVVNSGEKLMEWPPKGHFYGLQDNSLCPANEQVYVFMDKVFTELAQLFPFEYIHMGGDETARNFWEKSEAVKALMKREKLKNLDEVQSYFVKRMEKIIASKGRKMIGWDEIMQGGLAPNATVMSWRGMQYGKEAAKQRHPVVMTPVDYCYLDYMQSDITMEPPVYASLRLKKVYQFEPVPDSVDAGFILGGQGNLWTEQVYRNRQVQYMIWPRAFALAEIFWSPRADRDWAGFIRRVEAQFPRLDAARVRYAPSMYDPSFKAVANGSDVQVSLENEVDGLQLFYSFDNSYPDQYYPFYERPLIVPKDASNLRVISYRNGQPVGRMITMPVAELRKRAGIK